MHSQAIGKQGIKAKNQPAFNRIQLLRYDQKAGILLVFKLKKSDMQTPPCQTSCRLSFGMSDELDELQPGF